MRITRVKKNFFCFEVIQKSASVFVIEIVFFKNHGGRFLKNVLIPVFEINGVADSQISIFGMW